MNFKNLDKSKEETTCVHFNGFENITCRMNVPYNRVKRFSMSWRPRAVYPCIGCLNRGTYCQHYKAPQPEDIVKARERTEQIIATKDAIAISAGRQTGIRGTIECLVCNNVLWYSIDMRGHMQGACNTPDCVRFEK